LSACLVQKLEHGAVVVQLQSAGNKFWSWILWGILFLYLIDLLKETHSMAHILLCTFYNKTIYSFSSSFSSSSPPKPVAMHPSLETNCLHWNSDSKTENLATKELDSPLKSQEKLCQITHQKTSQIYYASKCSCSTIELIRAETTAPYF
jgi:hypothetical protein